MPTAPTLVIPTDPTDRFMLGLSGYVSEDASGKFSLRESAGRRRSGRPTRYVLHGTGLNRAPTFTAYGSVEATQKANEWLAKHCSFTVES